MNRDEPDKKFNEECSTSVECSPRGSHHSESTEMLTAPKKLEKLELRELFLFRGYQGF